MRFAIKLIILSLVILSYNFAHAEEKEICKACFLEWGKQGGKDLPDQGFNPDLVSTVLREAGYEPKVDIIPWKRCLALVKSHEYDFVAGYWRGKEGDKYFDYLRPTTIDKITFIVLKDSPCKSGKMEDMYGKRVGYLENAGGLETFRNNENKFETIPVSGDKALLRMLKNHRIDAIVSNSQHITSLAEIEFPDLVGKLRVLSPPIQINITSVAISWTHPKREEIKRRYNKAYDKLVAEGLYERLMKKHGLKVEYKLDDLELSSGSTSKDGN